MTKLTLTEFGAQNAEGGRELGQIRNERKGGRQPGAGRDHPRHRLGRGATAVALSTLTPRALPKDSGPLPRIIPNRPCIRVSLPHGPSPGRESHGTAHLQKDGRGDVCPLRCPQYEKAPALGWEGFGQLAAEGDQIFASLLTILQVAG